MLELGAAMTDGVRDELTPVLSGGQVVASLRARGWRETVAATVGERSWTFHGEREELTGRRDDDTGDVVRFRARRTGYAGPLWDVELHEVPVQMQLVSAAHGTHRSSSGDRVLASTGSTAWSAGLTLDAAPGVPLDHQVFLLWVALLTRRRSRPAAF